jgi:hypothetical protein
MGVRDTLEEAGRAIIGFLSNSWINLPAEYSS